jgi:hypothetical protein
MNIAILYTGQVRVSHSFEERLDSIKNLFKNFSDDNIDFFCTTWYEDNIDFKKMQSVFSFKVFDIETNNDYTTQFVKDHENFRNFCENYASNDVDYCNYSERDRLCGAWKTLPIVFHKLHRCVKIIEKYQKLNSVKYDLIFRLRWDADFGTSLERNHILEVISQDKLSVFKHSYDEYINKFKDSDTQENIMYHKYVDGWVDETVYYSNMKTMILFTDVYNYYYDIAKNNNCWIIHVILQRYIYQTRLKTCIPRLRVGFKNRVIYHYYNLDL